MRFGIPLLADRVAPRCTFADCVLVVRVNGRRIREESEVPLNGNTWADLVGTLSDQGVDTLICGGIAPATRESIRSRDMEVIENVAGTREEVLRALEHGRIRRGFGLMPEAQTAGRNAKAQLEAPQCGGVQARDEGMAPSPGAGPSDCLECTNRVCLRGESCPYLDLPAPSPPDEETQRILESTWDVALEEERTLCRLAELVYFGLEMGYHRLGVAFCEDLREPAAILTRVLRRFFDVVPIGCKAHGVVPEAHSGIEQETSLKPFGAEFPCDPRAVADILNSRETDLNVLVGFCAGADCVFNRRSQAPVTTIFVKDKSLANNPIGAVYSHYYLTDI